MFVVDLIRARSREGMTVANAKGSLRGKKSKRSASRESHPLNPQRAGAHAMSEISALCNVDRSTANRATQRARTAG